MKRSLSVIGALMLSATAFNTQAVTLYSNFDPTAVTPDYNTTAYADLSGSCSNSSCLWINGYSAGFSFTPTATGIASLAYLPMSANYTLAGAERIYGLTITDSLGQIVARGGEYGRNVPIGTTQVYAFDLYASTSVGQSVGNGVLSPTAPELVAGETYYAYLSQTYGSMSGTYWYKSNEVPTSGQADVHCSTNGGGYCAYWAGYWAYPLGYSFTAPMTDFLPALTITDGTGYGPAPSAVPVPAAAWLFGSGLLGLVAVARRRQQ